MFQELEQIDNQIFQIKQQLKDCEDGKLFLSPEEKENLLKGFSDLLVKKADLLNKPLYTEAKFDQVYRQILGK